MNKLFETKGQGLVEYALILILVAAAVVMVLWVLMPTVGNIFTNISNSLTPVLH